MAQTPGNLQLRSDPQSFVFVAQNPNDSPKKASVYSQARRDTERKKRQRAIEVLKTSKPLPVKHFSAREQQSSQPQDSLDLIQTNVYPRCLSPSSIAIDCSIPFSLDPINYSLECQPILAHSTPADPIIHTSTTMQTDSSRCQCNQTELQRVGQNHTFCELSDNISVPYLHVPQTGDCNYTMSAHFSNDLHGELPSTQELFTQNSHIWDYEMPDSAWTGMPWSDSSFSYSQESNGDVEELETSVEEIEWVEFGLI